MYKTHKEYDVLNIVQAYNFGGDYLEDSGKTYSLERAIDFSKKKANGKTVTYNNPIAVSIGYSYRYAYGNIFYAQLAKQYLTSNVNSSGGNSAVVQSALKELQEGEHIGGQKILGIVGI